MRKRILYVADTASRLYHCMVPFMEMMADKGYIVEAAARADHTDPYLTHQPCLDAFYPIDIPQNPLGRAGIRAYRKIKRLLGGRQYALIHTNAFAPSLLTRLAARDLPAKVVYMAHGLGFYRGAPLVNWLMYYPAEMIASRFTAEMVALNMEDFILARRAFPRTHVHYIPSVGIDLYDFQPMNYMRAGHKIILCVGELTRRKNQRQVLCAAAHLQRITPGFKVWFVGEGPMLDTYKRLAKRLGVDSLVEWLGYRHDIKTLLYKSDIVVSASRKEGVSRSLIEAMACGKPIVATDIRGHRELIAEGVNGYTVPLGDAGAMARACAELLHHPDILEMGSASRIMCLKYDIEYIKQRMASVYGV
jgi:glycosyltransferase EpsD